MIYLLDGLCLMCDISQGEFQFARVYQRWSLWLWTYEDALRLDRVAEWETYQRAVRERLR